MRLICYPVSHRWLMLIAGFFLSLPISASPASSWQRIGSTHINSSSEMATILIHQSAKNTVWKSIKLHVSKGDIKIRKVKLLMSDDQIVMMDIQKQIKAGLSTRVLTVPDHGRTIKKVTLFYQIPGDHSADITLMATDVTSQDS